MVNLKPNEIIPENERTYILACPRCSKEGKIGALYGTDKNDIFCKEHGNISYDEVMKKKQWEVTLTTSS